MKRTKLSIISLEAVLCDCNVHISILDEFVGVLAVRVVGTEPHICISSAVGRCNQVWCGLALCWSGRAAEDEVFNGGIGCNCSGVLLGFGMVVQLCILHILITQNAATVFTFRSLLYLMRFKSYFCICFLFGVR